MKNKYKIIIAGALTSFITISFIVNADNDSQVVHSNDDQYLAEIESTDYNYEEASKEVKPIELTSQEKMVQDIIPLIDSKLAFDTGSYIQGDIPPGDYAFISFDGSGKYYVEKDNAGNIIDNENFDSFGYVHVHGVGNIQTKGVLINISAFEQLGVTSAKEIYEKMNDFQNYQQSAYYKVGIDIPSGTYVLESYGSGYVAIMSGPVGKSDIIDNENFDGRYSVTVTDGQYLKVSRANISQ